jgi:hypothetical protein
MGQWGSVPHTGYPVLTTSNISIERNGSDSSVRGPSIEVSQLFNPDAASAVVTASHLDVSCNL